MAETYALLTAPGAPFEMRAVEIAGVATRAYVHAPDTLLDLFAKARSRGDRDAIVLGDDRVSYTALHRAAVGLAVAMRERLGVEPGDRIAIAMRNLPEWIVGFWAGVVAGAIVVPLNAWGSGDELAFAVSDCAARVVLADGARADAFRAASGWDAALVVCRGDAAGKPNEITFDDLVAPLAEWSLLPDVGVPAFAPSPDDPVTLFYTSGTTGRPKGALGTHRNILTNLVNTGLRSARAAVRRGEAFPPPAGAKRILLPVPLFHVTGTHSCVVPAMNSGSTIVLMDRWRSDVALRLIDAEAINNVITVPTIAAQLVEELATAQRVPPSLEMVSWGGAPAGRELHRRAAEVLPGRFLTNGYGMTETSSVIASNSAEDMAARPDSVGTVMPCDNIRIVDEAGNDVASGAAGELLVRGPNVVAGYWRRPDESSRAIRNGWLHTGDIARLDEEGFLYILDRATDMLIRGGENVYCAEIEAVLLQHPAIEDAAVFGVPHALLGEEVGVALVPRGEIGDDDLRAHVAASLARFKVPQHIFRQHDPLPRNAGGKVVKTVLRTRYAPAR
jgi:long-chain acyl-CoA synthetase